MKCGFIQEPQKVYPVTVLCDVMHVGRTPHAWAKRPGATAKDQQRQRMEQCAARIFEDSRRTYGSRRFKVTTDSHHGESISPNLLDRQFDVAAPNTVWTTDITYVWTLEGWRYVAIVIDLFSRRVVVWAADGHLRAALCVQALHMAFWRRKPAAGLLHHSDRGSQYASAEYRGHLEAMGMRRA